MKSGHINRRKISVLAAITSLIISVFVIIGPPIKAEDTSIKRDDSIPLESADKPKVELKKHFPTKQFEKGEDIKWSHAPYNMGRCSLCHESDNVEKPGPMRASVNRICFSCHKREKHLTRSKKVVHKAVKKDCGYCHNAHNAKEKSLIYTKTKDLCVTCHTTQKNSIAQKVQHDPVNKDKTCTNCHDPHASNFKNRLASTENTVCLDCHGAQEKALKDNKGRVLVNIKKLTQMKFGHEPFSKHSCSECHNTHGSKYRRLLLADYPSDFYAKYADRKYALCYKCHKKERITSKKTTTLTGFRDGNTNLHYVHVVKPEYGRSCNSCHETHATSYKHLIRKSVPYGPEGWQLELNYVGTAKGGRCTKTCHDDAEYNNKGNRPKDISKEYKKRMQQNKNNK